ncbi:MAG: GTP-dependent dephospho-CoA kinase family protein [Hadesarchaea archaeon]|nr:GTP-dependent dephospho-CoA kinase family protein [Hadesarchaea archaeon]
MPDEVRPLLKRPLGQLFPDVAAAIERLRQLHPPRLITVGDVVAAELLEAGIRPDVAVVDMKVMRLPVDEKTRRAVEAFEATVVRVKNQAGSITPELREALEAAKPPLKIVVEGEEDLATLPAVLSAPLGSAVIYGQPGEGLVLVEVTEPKRREFEMLLKQFKTSR